MRSRVRILCGSQVLFRLWIVAHLKRQVACGGQCLDVAAIKPDRGNILFERMRQIVGFGKQPRKFDVRRNRIRSSVLEDVQFRRREVQLLMSQQEADQLESYLTALIESIVWPAPVQPTL